MARGGGRGSESTVLHTARRRKMAVDMAAAFLAPTSPARLPHADVDAWHSAVEAQVRPPTAHSWRCLYH
jgi:hypothetical protein